MSLRYSYESTPSEEIARRVAAIDLSQANWLRSTTTAAYDPIFTPIFTAILGTGGITIGASTITYASIATAIATTALTVGLQMMLAPKPPTPEDAKYAMRQPIPYRIWGVGRTRMSGALVFYDSTANSGGLGKVHAIAGHRVKSFNRFWLHDDEVTFQADGITVNNKGDRYQHDTVRIITRLGLNPETAYAEVISAFPNQWTVNHRGDGQASMAMLANAMRAKDQAKTFPYGPPEASAEVDLAYCWDPRDSAQDPEKPSTWAWTQNPALHIIWHLCFNEFGYGLDYKRAILPVVDLWNEEADICDEDIPNAGGGTHKRFQCNGFDTTENGPKAGLNAMLATCDGHLVSRGDGARILTVGKFREDRVVTITDADIVGHQIQYDVLFDEECNRLVPKFNYPDVGYSTSDTDFFEDVSRQLTAGRVLPQDGNYQWCTDWRQARFLGKRDWLRIQEKARGTLNVRLSGINAVYARWIRLETPKRIPTLNGSLIENRKSILDLMKGGFSLDFIKHPDDIDAWTPATDEGQQPPVPTPSDPDEIYTPVINLVQAKPSSDSVYLRVVIVDPDVDSYTPVVRYRVTDTGSGVPGTWVSQEFPDADPSGGFIAMSTNVVPSDQNLDVQVAFKTSGGSYGTWSSTASVTSTVYPNPPADVTDVAASTVTTAGQAQFSWTAPNDQSYGGARLYWGVTNSFSAATLYATRYGSPGDTVSSRLTGLTAGTRYGWVVAVNKSGKVGNAIATGPYTVS